MGKKLTAAEVAQHTKDHPMTGFDICSKCNGVESQNSMQPVDENSEDFDLICDECAAEAKQKVQVTAYDDESGAAWKLMFGDETVEDGFDSTADAEMWARDNGYIPVSQEPESYTVTVCRTGYGFAYIEVMARSPEEAEELAMKEAGDHNYSEKASEYTPDGVNKF